MTLRCVQAGRGEPRPAVFLFLDGPGGDADHDGIGDQDEKLIAALGPEPCIVADDSAKGAESMSSLLAYARRAGGFSDPAGYALVGYSMGVQRVRALLVTGADPMATVCIDGTHASKPPVPWQIDVWRELAAEARRGERLFVATCTLQRYVERLSPGAYTSTSRVLAAALDASIFETMKAARKPLIGYPGVPVAAIHEGALHAYAYASTNCDHGAHLAQGRDVLPAMLAEHVRAAIVTLRPPAPPPEPVHNEPWAPLAERCVLWCENEMARGIREEPPGSNTSERIREYLAPCVRRATGLLLGLRAGAWCAAAQSCAQRECLAPGEQTRHGYRAAVSEIVEDAKQQGTFRDRAYRPKRGDLMIRTREGGLHVARVRTEPLPDGSFTTIAGNESDRWSVSAMKLTDPRIVGWVVY